MLCDIMMYIPPRDASKELSLCGGSTFRYDSEAQATVDSIAPSVGTNSLLKLGESSLRMTHWRVKKPSGLTLD